MKQNLTSRIVIALVAIGSIHTAQTPTKQAPKATEASLEPEVPLHFAVAGLTKENATAIKTALTELSVTAYVCDTCKVEQAAAGTCSKCSAQLQMAKRPALGSVAPMPDDTSISLTLNPRRIVRLTEIEAALKKSGVTIDNAKLPLPGRITFVAKGGTADKLAVAKKALTDANLFEEVTASFDAASAEMRFTTRAKATPPTRAMVAKTFEAQQLQLVDVIFGRVLAAG